MADNLTGTPDSNSKPFVANPDRPKTGPKRSLSAIFILTPHLSMHTPSSTSEIESQRHRQRAIAWVVLLTAIIALPASPGYAQQFQARHQRGELSFVQVTAMLLTSVFLVLYRSWTDPGSTLASRHYPKSI